MTLLKVHRIPYVQPQSMRFPRASELLIDCAFTAGKCVTVRNVILFQGT